MSNRFYAVLALVAAALFAVAPAAANHGPMTDHLAPSNANVDLISKLKLSGVTPERVTDVATYRDTAYVGAWGNLCNQAGESTPGGFWSIDIGNPRAPRELAYISAPAWTYQTEGVHAMRLTTPAFTGDILVVSNEICDSPDRPANAGTGGITIYDVTNPAAPVPLVLGFGDTDNTAPRRHESHTAFAWDVGDKAYAVFMDNEEGTNGDVDIADITDPRNPVLIRETGLDDWAGASTSYGLGGQTNIHDVVVRRVEGHWKMLISYWDAGYVVLNVDDPANPVFEDDTDYPATDPFTGVPWSEGNGHEAEWDRCPEEGVRSRFACGDVRYILAADEDFQPKPIVARITSGPYANEQFGGVVAPGSALIDDDTQLVGATRYVGQACAALPAAPANTTAITERGTCSFQVKLDNIRAAGYIGGLVFNTHLAASASPCEGLVNMLIAPTDIPFIFVDRSTGYRLLGITGYNTASCPSASPTPALPASGTAGSNIDVSSRFDGWGYLRLYNADTYQELDQFAIPEAIDERFSEGFGDLTIHEITTDPTGDVGYIAWYSGGFRVVDYSGGTLQQVGHHIDTAGNNHWGVELNVRRDGRLFALASDRDYGLYIYRFGTDMTNATSNGRGRVGQTMTIRSTVRNDGTISETNAKWTTRLPRGVRARAAFASQGRCSISGRNVTCNLGRVVEGGRAGIVLRLVSTRRGTLRAESLINGRKAEYDVGNNTDPFSLRVRAAAAAAGAGALTGRNG